MEILHFGKLEGFQQSWPRSQKVGERYRNTALWQIRGVAAELAQITKSGRAMEILHFGKLEGLQQSWPRSHKVGARYGNIALWQIGGVAAELAHVSYTRLALPTYRIVSNSGGCSRFDTDLL